MAVVLGCLLAAWDSQDTAPPELLLLARHQGADGGWGRRPSGCGCALTPKWPAGSEPDAATKAAVERLIGRLAEEEVEIRMVAERELLRIGPPAVAQLRLGALGSDAETAARCRGILDRLGGSSGLDAELTGLALLAFLGAGYTHLSRDEYEGICFGKVVRAGLEALQRRQGEDGSFDAVSPAANAVAALAMQESYGLTGSNLWRASAERGVASVERHVSKDPRLTAWKALVARSADAEKNWREATEPVRAMHERLSIAASPAALSGTVILKTWLDRRRGGSRAESLSSIEPATLGSEELLFACIAVRAAWKPSEAAAKGWMEKVKERVHRPEARPRCGFGELAATTRESAIRMLILQAYYRYGNALAIFYSDR
jgi:hypothetical protein